MAGGDAAHRAPDDPGSHGPPSGRGGDHAGPEAAQREILAQFEAAIAGMRTRDIQIGLRQLLATSGSAAPGGGFPGVRGARGNDAARAEPGVARGNGAGEVSDGATALTMPRPWACSDLDDMPAPVAELVLAVRTPSARRQMERLISEAELHRVSTVSTDTAARMVRPYTWLLERVGDEGIRLTDAGHLTPGDVTAVIDALGLAGSSGGRESASMRENQAPAVVQLRESAQATGLVCRQRGRLLLTATGNELRSDPAALWSHLAGQMPLRSAGVSEIEPGLILLACVAARFTDTLNVTIARMLSAIGWMKSDGSPVTGAEAAEAASGTHAVLRRLGVLPHDPRPGHVPWPAPEGVAFARAALRTWP